MPRLLPFTKMHGLGNDFVVIDSLAGKLAGLKISPDEAQRLCDRRFGVGADQILWLKEPLQSREAHARMEILNSDGSTAEMCGNGIRAVGLYLRDHGPKPGLPQYKVETLAGLKILDLRGDLVTVDMGPPELGQKFAAGEKLSIDGRELVFHEVSMGNPHAVIFVDDAAKVPLESWGPKIETHSRFPKRTNVEFVEVRGPREIRVRVWERGAGVTLACGTGACASAVATLALGKAENDLRVGLPGGDLTIRWQGSGKPVLMTGPAEEVFQGEYRQQP